MEFSTNQAKLKSWRTTVKYKFGPEIPQDYHDAMQLDWQNGNDRSQKAIDAEIDGLDEYETFNDIGHHKETEVPNGYNKIRGHFVFDFKHDGRHKARYVADGHLTPVPLESVYSGVVILHGFRMVVFLAELNGLPIWNTDVSSAYLEVKAKTAEKVYIIAGNEFGEEQAGHILIVVRALYGLRRSGQAWSQRFADVLRAEGFFPCKAEPDIWMRDAGDKYEYMVVYVDDLALALKEPEVLVKVLKEKYKFKLKGTGPIDVHLGMSFSRDEVGILCISSRMYLDKIHAGYDRIFGGPPSQNVQSPLEKGDHPELDTSELLSDDGIHRYQSHIGSIQWIVSIGRSDIQTGVMTMSSFRAAPREGHLDRVKRIFGYLAKFKHATVRVRVSEPDCSSLPDIQNRRYGRRC